VYLVADQCQWNINGVVSKLQSSLNFSTKLLTLATLVHRSAVLQRLSSSELALGPGPSGKSNVPIDVVVHSLYN